MKPKYKFDVRNELGTTKYADCPNCDNVGKVRDQRDGRIRDCVCCKGTGKVRVY